MENQPPRINWLRLATIARAADADPQPQPEPVQPAQAPIARQPTLPIIRVPVVPLPVTQPRATAPPLTQPTSQPIIQQQVVPATVQPAQPVRGPAAAPVQPAQPERGPATPPVQPAQPDRRLATPPVQPAPLDRRPVTPPPQQDIPKSSVPTGNGVSKPLTAPSPPPSPKVIKTSIPTPPPSPRVKLPPQVSPISVPKTADPGAETKSPLVLSQLKSTVTQENGGKKVNGNGGNADTSSKMNGALHNNSNSKNSNGSNIKGISSDDNHGKMNHTPTPEKKEIENGQGTYEARAKPPHLHSGTTMPHSSHKKSEKDMKVVTIAGENIGALMELGHNVHGYSRKMHHGGNSLTSDSPAQNGKATESMDDKRTARLKPATSLVNSNVQSINNSLLFNSSCTQRSPGVHLTFKTRSKGKAHKHGHDSTS